MLHRKFYGGSISFCSRFDLVLFVISVYTLHCIFIVIHDFFFGAFTCIRAWVVLWVWLFPQTYSEIIGLGQKMMSSIHDTLMECH